MDHSSTTIDFSGWRAQWLDRTHEGLYWETMLTICTVGMVSVFVSSYMFYKSIRFYRDLKENPSERAAICAKNDKVMLKGSKAIFFLSNIYLYHALAIWIIDAAIGIFTIAEDVESNPEHYDIQLWLNLAIHSIVMVGIFMSVFIIFPALQMVGMGYLIARSHRQNSTDGTLSAYVTPARTVSSMLAHLWTFLGFSMVICWPVFESTTMRVICLEAVFGSAMTWLHASYLFTFRGHQFEHVEVQQILGVSDGVRMYGQQIYAVHTGKGVESLPQHETMSETAPLLNEKSES